MFLQNVEFSLIDPILKVRGYVAYVLIAFAIIWAINIVNWILLRGLLNILGIYPRSIWGLPGIIFAPILHGDFNHLFFNTLPAFVLICFILLGGVNVFVTVTTIIVLISGALTWLFGRKAIHIGMSALIAGYFGFLLVNFYNQRTLISIVLALVTLYYFGGILLSLFPKSEKVSWEGHVFGFIAGLAASFLYPHALYYYFLTYYYIT